MDQFTIKSEISKRSFLLICIKLVWTPLRVLLNLLVSSYSFYWAFIGWNKDGAKSIDLYVFGAIGIAILLGAPLISILKIKKRCDRASYFKSEAEYSFYPDEILIVGYGVERKMVSWTDIYRNKEMDNYFVLITREAIYCVSERSMSEEEKEFIRSKKRNLKWKVGPVPINRGNKMLYLIGIAGIIPFFGALIGGILVVAGLVKYKDKLLVCIGLGGILASVAFYGFMEYDFKYGKSTREGFAAIAKIELDSLTGRIKSFKEVNGHYPDSLEAIHTAGSFINIKDPMLIRKGADGTLDFKYKKIGSRFTLFSVGIDGIPNTSDDIYPDIMDSVTNADLIR